MSAPPFDLTSVELRRFYKNLTKTEEKITQSRTLIELVGRLLLQVDDDLITLDSFVRLTRRRTAMAIEQHARSSTASLGSSNMASFAAEFKELLTRYDVLGNLPFEEESLGDIDTVSSAKAEILSGIAEELARGTEDTAVNAWKERLEVTPGGSSTVEKKDAARVEEAIARVVKLLGDPSVDDLAPRVVQLLDGPVITI